MVKKIVTKEKALERLSSLCNRSEQCEFEINRKMINWGIISVDREEVLDKLKEQRLVDDARFAKSYTNDKVRFSSWGPYKIRMELMKRRVKSSYISEAINRVEPSVWKEAIIRIAVSKSKTLDLIGENGKENRQKLFKFLISRGFSSTTSTKAVNFMKKKQEETC